MAYKEVQRFRKMYYDTIRKINGTKRYHVILGTLHNYPECCVTAFADGWCWRKVVCKYPWIKYKKLEYVPCPECCENRFGDKDVPKEFKTG